MNIESSKPITSTDMYLDEIVSILRSMEITQEQMEETMNCLLWQALPFWRRWAAQWRNSRHVVEQTEREYDKAPAPLPMKTYACTGANDGSCPKHPEVKCY